MQNGLRGSGEQPTQVSQNVPFHVGHPPSFPLSPGSAWLHRSWGQAGTAGEAQEPGGGVPVGGLRAPAGHLPARSWALTHPAHVLYHDGPSPSVTVASS